MRLLAGNSFLVLVLSTTPAWADLKTCAPSEDIPDAAFIDSNCDGVDGDIAKSFFVAPSGSDSNPGTMTQPFATIAKGVAAAAADATRKHLLVAAGTYPEMVIVPPGVSLFGLYEPTLWRRSPLNVTTIASPGDTALVVDSYVGTGAIEGFQLIAANATGASGSSYGARLSNIGGTLAFRYNVLRPGSGGNGQSGMRGADGRFGGNGGNGDPGCERSWWPCSSCSYPMGGAAGTTFVPDYHATWGGLPGHGSNSGYKAYDAPGFSYETGKGVGGTGGTPGQPGQPGGEGNNGVPGQNGAGGSSVVVLSGTLYQPSNGMHGATGGHGTGGAGGGGGGGGTSGCDSFGSGGGGGGGAGEGGGSGTAGWGGGASLGLVVQSAGSGLSIEGNTIVPKRGGDGGAGGSGGWGGLGGRGGIGPYGGSGQDDGGVGGAGGWGGLGGRGGAGGGGAGGASWGIVYRGSSAAVRANVIDLSQAAGGSGAYSDGNPGQAGSQGASEVPNDTTVPTPPVNVLATASNRAAQVSFRAPLSTGNSAITSYTVTAVPGAITALGSGSPLSVTGLTNGTAYTFTVHATNGVGNSGPSAPSNLVVPHALLELDLNGDARSDLLWHNASTGQVYRMLMSGPTITGGAIVHTEPNTAWRIVGDGDFNGDGVADLLWRNSSTGQLYEMTFNASGLVAGGVVFYAEPNAAWKIVQTPDLDGDGKADLVWWNSSTGQVYYMLLNGPSITQQGFIYQEPDTSWRIVASGDFSGSGKQNQLLWHNASTGALYLMSLNVAGVAGVPPVSGTVFYQEPNVGWKVVGAADFDGDGKSDILWRNQSTGVVHMMLMNGTTIVSQAPVYVESNPDWRIAAMGDYDGDGKADIVWFNDATGEVFMLLMNGLAITQSAIVYQEPNPAWDLLGRPSYVP